jgi:hypothetical protein
MDGPYLPSNFSSLINLTLTNYGRALLEEFTDPQLVKKFPALYVTRKFITAFTRPHHLHPNTNHVVSTDHMAHRYVVFPISTLPRPL